MLLGVRLNWAVWLSQGIQYLLMKMSPTRKMLKTKGIEIVKWTAVVFFLLYNLIKLVPETKIRQFKSPLDSKEIQPVHPKGSQSRIFIGRTDAKVETPILWSPDAKNWLIWKDPDAGKDWRQEEKGTTEDEIVGWHHQLHWHEFE